MGQIRILDLDGSITAQDAFRRASRAYVYQLRQFAETIRLGCSATHFHSFQIHLEQLLGPCDTLPTFTLIGSGDFHHVSLALLRRVRCPVNLLVVDNHPDWMRGVPLVHCGTWLAHALQLPQVKQIFHVGGEVDFDNSWRWLAPWRQLYSEKIVPLPAVRTFQGRRWRRVPHAPLRIEPDTPLSSARLELLLAPHRAALREYPLYITVDKDVLTTDDASVNWDSGHLTLPELGTILEVFLESADHQLVGMDTTGDWSPVKVRGALRTLLHFTEHPFVPVDPATAVWKNQLVNAELMRHFRRASARSNMIRRASWDAAA